MSEVTRILGAIQAGDPKAAEELLPLVYQELRKLAAQKMAIYSLGVVLYELLTGKTPFDAEALFRAGIDEICRTIRETEPPKPSTRLTQELVAADVRRLTSKSEIRNPKWTEPPHVGCYSLKI